MSIVVKLNENGRYCVTLMPINLYIRVYDCADKILILYVKKCLHYFKLINMTFGDL